MTTSHTDAPSVAQLLGEGIAACRSGQLEQARALLIQVVQQQPRHELAWLWLSGCVGDDAERRYCLEQVLAINPANTAAQRGLAQLPATPSARSPLPPSLPRCAAPGCTEQVARAGHRFCYAHWKAMQAPAPMAPAPATTSQPTLLTATALGERLGLPSQRVNQVLAELGWISRQHNGWAVTARGQDLGAVQRVHPQNETPFVVWPEQVLEQALLQRAVRELNQHEHPTPSASHANERSFRERFPAQHRTSDGHMVRSKAEVLIDDWLYHAGIVHAYERRLPIEEEAYCDFYLRTGQVYIEYWGLENDPAYLERKRAKQALYRRHRLNLIELTDTHIRNLDDHLPQLLLAYSVTVR
jgi:hypothetical protein